MLQIILSDAELVAAVRENDRSAFNYLYVNYSTALSFVIHKVVRDKHITEDILQEVFIQVWHKIDQYNNIKGTFYNWMLNIARNKSIDFLRSKVGKMNNLTDLDEAQLDGVSDSTEQHVNRIGISKIVMNLPTRHRELVYLAYYKGHTMNEISRMNDMPMGTVKTRMRTTLSMIRNEFNYSLA